jgi:hypothetical protein
VNASLKDISTKLAKQLDVLKDHEGIVDVYDSLAGAIYSLKRLDELLSWNRTGPRLPDYKDRVSLYLLNIADGIEPMSIWVSGYFLNSALQRIAACYDRIPKLLFKGRANEKAHERMQSFLGVTEAENKRTKWHAVYVEVNSLKHEEAGLASGRKVTKDDAVEALAEIASALEVKINLLKTLG